MVLLLATLSPRLLPAADFTPEEIQSYATAPDFTVVEGTIKLNPAFGFSDGEYLLKETKIEALGEDRYKLNLHFSRKKGSLSYGHDEVLDLLYNGRRLWFKRGDTIYRFVVPEHREPVTWNDRRTDNRRIPPMLHVDLSGLQLTLRFEEG